MDKPKLYTFRTKPEATGDLTFLEELTDLPFEIKRVYWLTDVPEQQIRGDHAHKTSQQVVICVKGEMQVTLQSRNGEIVEFLLDQPNQGVYIPPLWWGKMRFSNRALMIGLASDFFSEGDYIRNREDFK